MPLTPNNIYSAKRLIPFYPEDARKTAIRLAPSKTFARGTVLALIAAASCVQTLTGNTNVTSGTYTLTFYGQTTAALAFNAANSAVQAALEALPAIGAGNVAVTGGHLGTATPFTITFQGALANVPVPQGAINVAALGGSGVGSITFVTSTVGLTTGTYDVFSSAVVAVPNVAISPSAVAGGAITAGTYNVFYTGRNANGETTLSAQVGSVTTSAGNLTIRIAAMTGLPAGLTNLDVYIAPIGGAPTFLGTIAVSGTSTSQTDFAAFASAASFKTPPTTNTAFVSSANVAAALLEYDCRTDAQGNIALSTDSNTMERQETYENASAFYSGDFRTSDLVGLNAKAIADLQGKLINGNISTGILSI